MKKQDLFKRAAVLALVGTLVTGNAMPSFAAGWTWLDENNDGISECYYLDESGHKLTNTTAPGGYTVNEDGAWVVNGEVLTQGPPAPKYDDGVKNITAADIDTNFADDTYNEWGVNRTAIDMVCHTREENAKYGEVYVDEDDLAWPLIVTYENGFKVKYETNGYKWQSLVVDTGRADLDWDLLLKFYFPNHHRSMGREVDTDEKKELLKELNFNVVGGSEDLMYDHVSFSFRYNDHRLTMLWYCNDTMVLMDTTPERDPSIDRFK